MRPWPGIRYGTGNCVRLFKVSLTNVLATGIMQQSWQFMGKDMGGEEVVA